METCLSTVFKNVLGSRQNKFTIFEVHQLLIHFMMTIHQIVIKWMQKRLISRSSVTCLTIFCGFFQLLILFTVMLLCVFEPAFCGKNLKKLNKELKQVNYPFFSHYLYCNHVFLIHTDGLKKARKISCYSWYQRWRDW